jgi:hypothetical protein
LIGIGVMANGTKEAPGRIQPVAATASASGVMLQRPNSASFAKPTWA